MSKLKIFPIDQSEPVVYLIGEGLMQIDRYECKIFTNFLINPDDFENNVYLKSQKMLQSLLEENQEKEAIIKKEFLLRKEIAKLKK